jgi:mono/diheme cytochrome c family protein
MRSLLTIVAAFALALTAGMADEATDRARQADRGQDLYRIYCRNCHGESGQGDGPMAKVLTVRPPDLTRLSQDHDGEFPTDDVYASIDGRDDVLSHGADGMPVWGLSFQQFDTDIDQERHVRARIVQLIEYLESIQTTPPRKK